MGRRYILLSGISAYEWGMCAALSETLWIGASEHLFNNFISNSLHTVTETGADELMIIRITLSLLLVLIISQKRYIANCYRCPDCVTEVRRGAFSKSICTSFLPLGSICSKVLIAW